MAGADFKVGRRGYLVVGALLAAWLLAVAFVPGPESSPQQAAARPGDIAAPPDPSEAPPPGDTSALEGHSPAGQPPSPPAGTVPGAGLSMEAGPSPPQSPDAEEPEGNPGDDAGGDPIAILPPGIEDDALSALAPALQALPQAYEAAMPIWDLANTVIGILTPPLVDLALALGPAVAILAEVGGGDLREACGYIGLIGVLYGLAVEAILPPVDVLPLLFPLYTVCGHILETVGPDEDALILDNFDFPF